MKLTAAIQLACEAHDGQKDKLGAPYIRHCLRVMEELAPDEEAMVVGVLHDVLEDTNTLLPPDDFTWSQWHALRLLTRDGESYEDYIARICEDQTAAGKLARNVKRGDLADNLDFRRMERVAEPRRTLLRGRYKAALDAIQAARKRRDLAAAA